MGYIVSYCRSPDISFGQLSRLSVLKLLTVRDRIEQSSLVYSLSGGRAEAAEVVSVTCWLLVAVPGK